MTPQDDQSVSILLARAPKAPRNPSLFTSGIRFGTPGTYPQGTPMAPAEGPDLDDAGARAMVSGLLAHWSSVAGDAAATARGLAVFDHHELHRRVSAPSLRAAMALLSPTIAAPAVMAFIAGEGPVEQLAVAELAELAESGRAFACTADPPTGARVLNGRYAAEHPAVVAPSLAHHLMWQATGDTYEEATLHAVLAMVHLQWVAVAPEIAHLGTELTRRQNSMALTLCNSRHPDSPYLAVRADDGPGTLPGGDPALDTPDFWSIPFTPRRATGVALPEPLRAILRMAWDRSDAAGPSPCYDEALADAMSTDLGHGWLPTAGRLRAACALGALTPADLASVAGIDEDEAIGRFGLADVEAAWHHGASGR